MSQTLRAINIKQLKPSRRNDSVFHIFERLNTGGTRLKAQEIRNAVYRGEIVDRLRALNETPGWRTILGINRADKSQKDVELILRLFSLFEIWPEYEKPMLAYLNDQMGKERTFSSGRADRFQVRFPKVVSIVNAAIAKPFRPKGLINSAVLEAVMLALLEQDKPIKPVELTKRYAELLEDANFLERITGGTTDTLVLRQRNQIAKRVLSNA